ncbi:MAG: hypothetical protein IJA93_08285 [Clostridia bacterium]|nr:hypothetical protein [Clostridia bacterium]
MKKLLALFLMIALSIPSALAVTEGKIEDAPDVDVSITIENAQTGYYLPDASYFESEYDDAPEWAKSKTYVTPAYNEEAEMYLGTSNPFLTPGEIERANILKKDYEAGNRTGDGKSILNKTENVSIAVYTLDPSDFAGEPFYHILPATNLTDEEILSLIDAYALMGHEFRPENLSYKNTMRGGGEETSRLMMEEEYNRLHALTEMIIYGYLDEDIKVEKLFITLDSKYHKRMPNFKLLPYRSLTDEELVSWSLSMGYHDESDKYDFAAIEKQARSALYELFKLPLSMQRESIFTEGSYIVHPFLKNGAIDWEELEKNDYEARETYGAMFFFVDADGVEVNNVITFDRETGAILSASSMPYLDEKQQAEKYSKMENQPAYTVTDADIEAAVRYAESIFKEEDFSWHVQERETSTNWGMCKEIKALIKDGYWLSVFISAETGSVRGISIDATQSVIQ